MARFGGTVEGPEERPLQAPPGHAISRIYAYTDACYDFVEDSECVRDFGDICTVALPGGS